jgi:hypothetical protein
MMRTARRDDVSIVTAGEGCLSREIEVNALVFARLLLSQYFALITG